MGQTSNKNWGKAALLTVASSIAIVAAPAALAQPAARQEIGDINLQAGPLGERLIDLSELAGVNIFAPSGLVAGKTAPAVTGATSTEEALRRLLAGSGLSASRTSNGAFIIARETAAADAPPQRQAAQVEDTIIVEAVRRDIPIQAIPNTVQLIDNREILQQLVISTSILDVIGAKVPSFSPTQQKLAGSGETLRGREPLFLIDSVPQSTPLRNGQRDGFVIDPAVIERVEIINGANAIQGIGATGGVINYVTLKPTEENRWQGRVEAGITTDDGFNGDGDSHRAVATVMRDFGAIDLIASAALEWRGAFYDSEGRRIGVDERQGDIQDSMSQNFFGKIGWDIDPLTRLQATFNAFDLEGDGDYVKIDGDRTADVPAISVRGTPFGEPQGNSVRTASLDFTREALFGGKLTAQGFYQDFEAVFGPRENRGIWQDPAIAPLGTLDDQSANNSEKYGFKVVYTRKDTLLPGLAATVGLDYLRDLTFQELILTGRNWVPEVEFKSIAPFAQFDYSFLDGRAHLTAGLRYESATLDIDTFTALWAENSVVVDGGDPDFSEPLFNAGGTYELIDGVSLYASHAEGFTMPDVGRVLRALDDPGQDIDTLLDVEPIVTNNTEVGVTIARARIRANAAFFLSRSDFGQRLAEASPGLFEVSREKGEIKGFEATIEGDLNDWISLGAGYALQEGQFDSDGDGEVDRDFGGRNIAPNRLNLLAEVRPTATSFVGVQLFRFFDREFNDAGTNTDFDGYTLVNILAGYDFDQFGRIDVGIQNAFDEEYFTYYAQSVSTANRDYYAGRGRTLTLRWSTEF